MKAFFLADDNIPFLPEILKQKHDVATYTKRELSREKIIASGAEILFVRTTIKANAELLADTDVKFIATATAGSDHFDKAFLRANNIFYADAAGSNSNSVAEYVIGGMLSAYKKRAKSVKNQTIGIIGFGNIGTKVAHYCHELGMKILINDPPKAARDEKFPDYCTYAELNEIMQKCDVITNHVPRIYDGKYKTIDLLDFGKLNLMKSDVTLIHASRGGVINEPALEEFLSKNPQAELIIDVYTAEPEINENLVRRALIATPHIAGHSLNGKLLGTKLVIDAYEKFSGEVFDKSLFAEKIKLSDFRGMPASEAELLENIEKYRNIALDNETFRKIMSMKNTEKAAEFDRQRTNYPVRYEYLKIINK